MLTGFLEYKEQEYSFIFQENERELQLIPIESESQTQSSVNINLNGISFDFERISMDIPFLTGTINENHRKIIFVTVCGAAIRQVNNILYIKLYAYFLFNTNDVKTIDKLSFCSPEIDHIFNANRGLKLGIQDIVECNKTGTITISTNNYESTTSSTDSFVVNDKKVLVSFQIIRKINTSIGKPPLSLSSCLCFEFAATNDYSFIIDLCNYARNFIRYLCFRLNIYFSSIDIYTPAENNKHHNIGTVNMFYDLHEPEQEPLKKGKCIKYEYISGKEGKILTDIADKTLYLRHLPKSSEDEHHIDIDSFIVITAAFEWEFNRNYPEGITKSKATQEIEELVTKEITELRDKSSGKKREKYKFLLKLVKSDSLNSKVVQVCKDFSEIIGVFGEDLYSINHIEFKSSEIGKRVSDQRNHYAHGDIDKEFIDESLLDVTFLKYLVYAIQLQYFGVTDENIRKAINDVFHLNYAL